MKLFALIVEASKAKGEAEIAGCLRDAERLKSWLSGNDGGAWEAKEIVVLNNPSPALIEATRKRGDDADFAFVSFSGHGRIVEDRTGRRRQMVTTGTGEEIDFQSLKPLAAKAIMLCDACREVHYTPVPQKVVRAFVYMSESYRGRYTRQDYRNSFEAAVRVAPTGTFTMYSCSPGEFAGDDVLNGGFFTDALISNAGTWCDAGATSGVLAIDTAFESAKLSVKARRKEQNPTGGPDSRSGNPFPFAVRLK